MKVITIIVAAVFAWFIVAVLPVAMIYIAYSFMALEFVPLKDWAWWVRDAVAFWFTMSVIGGVIGALYS